MSYHLSRSDIRFLRIIFAINKFFGVVPSYDFDKAKITHPVLNKIQAFTYTALIISSGIYCLSMRRIELSMFYSTPQMILDFIHDAALNLLTASVILSSCFSNQTQWIKLMNAFQQIDKQLNTRNSETKHFTEYVLVHFVLCNLVKFGCLAFFLYTWYATMEYDARKSSYYWADHICGYYHFLTLFLVFNLGRAFECRYKEINEALKESVTRLKDEKEIGQDSGCLRGSLRSIACMSRRMCEMVEMHNEIFGWTLLWCLGLCVVIILVSLNLAMAESVFWRVDTSTQLSCYILALFTLVSTSMVVMSCDFASRESKKITSLCYRLQENLPVQSLERRELLLLAKISAHNVARFTAADFLELNRNTLCYILGITTTYLIVMIQFDHNSARK